MKHLLSLAIALLLTPAPARAQDEVVYYHTDAIGSVRMITDATGAVVGRYDYLPFGVLWPAEPAAPTDPRQFAGKERDSETGLDYFGARYYRAPSGRFTSVDPFLNIEAAMTDPQRWNRYSYAVNRPFAMIDPDGREAGYVYLQNGRVLSPFDRDFPRSQNPIRDTVNLAAGFGAGLFGGPIAGKLASEAQVAMGRLLLWVGGTAAGAQSTAAALRRAAADGGETLRIVSNQTQAPVAGRVLHAAAGENAQAIANAFRSGEGVRTFAADLPKALLNQLERVGYLQIRNVQTTNGLSGREYRFAPEAYDYIAKFLKEVHR